MTVNLRPRRKVALRQRRPKVHLTEAVYCGKCVPIVIL